MERQTKHVDICYHYIREQVEEEKVDLYHIPGEDNPADLFTKPLPAIKILKFRKAIGLMEYNLD